MNERVIVCGAGGISNAWFNPIKAENLQVVAVVDLRKDAAEKKIAEHQLAAAVASDDLDQTLAEFAGKADFLVDLTIPDSHCAVTCKALTAGFHVVGEKPLAPTLAQARQMLATSEKTGKLYMVSQSRRWDTNHVTIANTLASAELGDLTTLNCDFFLAAHFGGFRDQMDSPLILDMAIHHFDLARMFSRQQALSVYADEFNPKGSWYQGNVAANCLFEMTGGVHFAYRGSWCSEGCRTSWNGDWRLIATQGTLLYAADQPPTGEVITANEGFFRPTRALAITPSAPPATAQHGALKEMLHFLRTGTRPQCECHDNIHSLAMVLAAIESSRTQRRVKLADLS